MNQPVRLTLRPVAESDDPFLFALYASTRAEEMAAWGWSAAQQEPFLRMQWLAQKRGYEARYPSEGHRILEHEGRPVGRLWVVRGEHELRLVDVTLLPAYRGSGLGTSVLRALQEEALAAGKPLRLHVLRNNPALRLYTRLGFTPVAEAEQETQEPYLALEWGPR
ncbi:MAG TPA: GNAT family N-acetyltransferase [Archangium sp.]|uniref:GNAT family N-acetyltransferase n=1 Tax=Archangium sp. TaxID=1872627 RepID=UPI002E34B3B6|nr:GNAT family N-acetyltransferase [Archangium sp.]HEX5747398.1 GNAT family N-acetyltransferase [Archangium sp.]